MATETAKPRRGPWIVSKINDWPFGVRVTDANGQDILHQDGACSSSEQNTRQDNEDGIGFSYNPRNGFTSRAEAIEAVAEQHATACLIAAAPELYWALKQIIGDLPVKRDWLDPAVESIAQAAIAKAEGRL